MSRTFYRYLVVSATGDARVAKRRPHLDANEVAYDLKIVVPDSWARVVGQLVVDMPDAPIPAVDITPAEETP
jgi:hypothetical protein